jgi:hypothetical protein
VEGWCSVEDLTCWGFAHAPVVMANEAHNGLTRCVRTRDIGVRIIGAAHHGGVRRLAMEALPWPDDGSPGPIGAIPPTAGGYLAQPEMRTLITTALDLGWSLWAYEARIDPGKDDAELVSLEFTTWREREQAKNLCQLRAAAPGEALLVWCGNGHACKHAGSQWVPMGHHFAAMSGIQQFVIDQVVTVDFPRPRSAAMGTGAAVSAQRHPGRLRPAPQAFSATRSAGCRSAWMRSSSRPTTS